MARLSLTSRLMENNVRKTVSTTLIVLMAVSAIALAPIAGARQRGDSHSRRGEAAPKQAPTGRVTVGYTSASPAAALKAAKANGGSLARGAKAGKTIVVTPPPGVSAEEFAADLSTTEGVSYAEPEVKMEALWMPNDRTMSDPAYANWQWGITSDHGIDMPAAWDYTRGDADVVVAVVDSGINPSHPDSPAHVDTANDWDFIDSDSVANDAYGHGTFVAGIIAAATNNTVGMAGIAPDCTVLPIRALNAYGGGTDVTVADGIIWAADHGADIINLSVGGADKTEALVVATAYARNKGCVLVAASGNNPGVYPGRLTYPAGLPGVISVGSIGTYDASGTFPAWMTSYTGRSSFSQYAYGLDLVAPGASILSLYQSHYQPQDGTSFAAPHVTGVAALVRTLHPDWSPDQVEIALEGSAHDLGSPGFDPYYGNGRVTAPAALAVATAPTVPPSDEDIPGLAIPASPVKGSVNWSGATGTDWQGDLDDVYSIEASAGQTIELALYGPAPTSATSPDLDLYLFGPDSTSVNDDAPEPLATPPAVVTSTEKVSYKVPVGGDGTYRADVFAYSGGGQYTLYWEKGLDSTITLAAPAAVTLGNYVTLSGRLQLDGGSAPSTRTVTVEAMPSGSSAWTRVAAGTTGASGGYSFKLRPSRTTRYRARFGSAGFTTGYSSVKTVTARSFLTSPTGPSKIKKRSKFTSVGYMRPRHATGSRTVYLRCYRYESGHWKYKKTVRATNVSNTSTTTKYKARYYLSGRGRWKVVARVKADTYHAQTDSAPRYIRVY